MYNTNWPLNQNKSTSNVDWGALADTWMQQREQQAQWQQAPPPPLPPPPPPQFLLSGPPIPPPGPMPIGMTFPPLPPAQLGIVPHYHQLQVGSNTTQESLTMTNIENASWRPPLPPPPSLMMPSGPQWRPNMNNNQPLFPMQPDIAPSFGGRNFWPPGGAGQQPILPPVPPPIPPPVPPQQSQMPPQFPSASYQHSPVDKRIMNTSFNTSIPSLMDLPSSYKQKPVPPPLPIPSVSILPIETTTPGNIPSGGNVNAKRRKIPAWLREELGRIEKEKEKKIHNTSSNNHSINDSSSKFDDDDDEEEEDTNHRKFTESPRASDDDDDDGESGQDEDEEPSSTLISSTPIVTRRSRFDDDKPTDQQLNVSAIFKRTYSPSPSPPPTTTTTIIEDDPVDREEQFMIRLRRALTELLLEVTNEEIAVIAKDVYLDCKAESSTPVIRKASGLSSLIQSFSGTDSDDEEEKNIQTIVKTTVITKAPIQPTPVKPDTDKPTAKSSTKTSDDDSKSTKTKKKKSSRDISPSKKHHHKKHRHHSSSSSSSSSSSQSRSQKKKKSSTHDSYSEHNRSKKYDDRGRKR